MTKAIAEIDKIRKLEPKWLLLLVLYIIVIVALFVVAYILNAVVRLHRTTAIVLTVLLIVLGTIALALITFIAVQEENIGDAKQLT